MRVATGGCAAGGGLGERHPPALAGRRAHHQPRAAVQRDQLVVGHASGERDPVGEVELEHELVELLAFVALSDDGEREPWLLSTRLGDRSDQLVVALHRDEASDGDHGGQETCRRPA